MTLRARILGGFAALVLIPLVSLAVVVRQQMSSRLTAQFQQRIASLVSIIERDLAQESATLEQRLTTLTEALAADNRFRRAAVQYDRSERAYLLDYAGNAMRLMGLSMLQLQNDSGRILSSGHFRNEYDVIDAKLPGLVGSSPNGTALLRARSAEGTFLTVARVDSFQIAGRRFYTIGGAPLVDRLITALAGDETVAVTIIYPGGMASSDAALSSRMTRDSTGRVVIPQESDLVAYARELRYIDETGKASSARIVVSHPLAPLQQLRREIDLTFLIAGIAAIVLALLLSGWLSRKLSRPIAELAQKTSAIELHQLDVDFSTDRTDEVGALSRVLAAMTKRLRASATSLKEAERRATIGEVSRQVNHDIKNGLIPIRNVLRHLTQVARDDPSQLAAVFAERQETLDAGISYLEQLAANYAKLYPRLDRRACDVNAVVNGLVQELADSGNARVRASLAPSLPAAMADDIVLKRILENLVGNAIDSADSKSGSVTVTTEHVIDDSGAEVVTITVADTGPGMAREQLDRIFEDFYTTKEGGTGLGLSIVRRLVMDLNGSLRVQSEPGVGTSFTVELPAAAEPPTGMAAP